LRYGVHLACLCLSSCLTFRRTWNSGCGRRMLSWKWASASSFVSWKEIDSTKERVRRPFPFKVEANDCGRFEMNLIADLDYPHLCPISLFLGIAFADDAFESITDPEQLFCPKLECEARTFKFKKSVLNLPVFKAASSCGKDQRSDQISAQTYSSSHLQFKGLGYRFGCRVPPTSYAIRRGAANILNGQ